MAHTYNIVVTASISRRAVRALPTLCRPPSDGPCLRCEPPPSNICCDKDTPELLQRLPAVEPYPFSKRPARSKMPKGYMPGKTEEEVTAALETWREAASLAWLSPEHQDFHGGAAVLSDKVLRTIVRCAANGKIKSIDDLRRETQWSRANRYGAEVLDLIKDLLPYHFRDNTVPPPLGDSTGSVNLAGARLVSYLRCCEACCMIFHDLLAHNCRGKVRAINEGGCARRQRAWLLRLRSCSATAPGC